MDDSALVAGSLFTSVYILILCFICYCGCTSGIEGNDGKLAVALSIAMIISMPVMWVLYYETSAEVAFWIIGTFPLWIMPYGVYVLWTSANGKAVCGQFCKCAECCKC